MTLTNRQDVSRALGEVVEQAQRVQQTPHGPRLSSQSILPPLRITVTPVASQV